MKVAVALLVVAPETPLKVIVFVPGGVFFGRIPETAST